jgi:RHS repeat-associated protein
VVASYRYDAWGNILEANGSLAQVKLYCYAGYRWDQITGLYFLQARYYNP